MPTSIKLHVRLQNGHLLSEQNLPRVRAYCDRLCTNVVSPKIDPRTYRETYTVQKHRHPRRGYSFREITHGMGICGVQPTLRRLVISTLGLGMRVEILGEDDAKLPPHYQPPIKA